MENNLMVIVKNSNLEPQESKSILDKFQDYDAIAKEWENKAKLIVVSDESQITEMRMAGEARKKFSKMRIDIEKTRKELKEQSLRKGQAIDTVAKYLVSLVEPIEKYLRSQEDFIEIKQKREAEIKKLAEEKRLEDERIAQLEAERVEQKKIKEENEKLKKEMEAQQKAMEAQQKAMEVERAKADAERKVIEDTAKLEKDKADKLVDAERLEKERVQKLLDAQIECPFCHRKFTQEHNAKQ